MRIVELRSDTFTLPDEGMRRAMAQAELGDDVWGEDPTVNRLQDMAAQIAGKEAALYVPSGCMANLVSLLVHCQRGEEVICGDQAHIYVYEAASAAAVGGLQLHTVPNNEDGTVDLDRIEAALRPADSHFARSRTLSLESTHNRCWGSPLSLDYLRRASKLARASGLEVHLDGARIFNASVAESVPVAEFAACADSISFCLSKGLGAPVGSLVCGTRAFIAEAHRMRKQLGGGMRQAGVIAAGGLYALEHRVERLAEDHAAARRLAAGIAAIPGLATEPTRVRTNIVYCDLASGALSAEDFVTRCQERGLLLLVEKGNRVRMVTHLGVEMDDIDRALEILAEVVA